MNKALVKKYKLLQNYLAKRSEIVIAYSGGVDSSLLLKVSRNVLGLKANAIIGKSPSTPQKEFNSALELAKIIGIIPIIIETNELLNSDYCSNPLDRCYQCKKIIFGSFIKHMELFGLKNLADGSNFDDLNDYRPGNKALKEFGILSPFRELGFTKNDIRELSKELKLPTWNKEALACLATRITYGETITVEKLKRVEQAEEYLRTFGFSSVRARLKGDELRIEVVAEQLHLFFEEGIRNNLILEMKKLGFKCITLDMEGYRMGSMNN